MEFFYLLLFFCAGVISQIVAEYYCTNIYNQQNKEEDEENV